MISDETEIATVQAAGSEDVDAAVSAARKALKHRSWKGMSPSTRGRMIVKLSQLIEEHAEILATIESWDNGLYSKNSEGLFSVLAIYMHVR